MKSLDPKLQRYLNRYLLEFDNAQTASKVKQEVDIHELLIDCIYQLDGLHKQGNRIKISSQNMPELDKI